MAKAKLASWNRAKGFGFLSLNGESKQLFVHISSFTDKKLDPEKLVGHWFNYTLAKDKQGRPCAKQLRLIGSKPAFSNKPNGLAKRAGMVALAFFVLLLSLVLLQKLPLALLVFYVVMSVVTFALYALDKSAAQAGRWRVQELKLHVFALIGGWPGAMLAQQTLRHKTQKQSFRWGYYCTVLLNIAALAFLLSPNGEPMLLDINQALSSLLP
ncbi:cold shock and DUF1294 domain-containing protein [Agarivorans aestuarii]|uniref:cold shock and DUF1294 domain-containing protein n=1 Tax=Agarivorans aestuarii TaxID=1563703 RepID=UPI001C7E7C2B|nr:cold shock and DUF1294 domain-containing protein [Agarivorans aestuarii]